MNYLEKINYFFSGWIENLGVVPLLLFSAFLFLPDLTFLFSLLFLVTAVFETIWTTFLYIKIHKVFKSDKLLLNFLLAVKIALVIYPWNNSYSKHQFVMSPGQVKEMQVTNIKHFLIENKEIVQVKPLENDQRILIKAIKLGHSKVHLMPRSKDSYKTKVVQIIVSSENDRLILEKLSKIGIKVKNTQNTLSLDGSIKNKQKYKKIIKQISKFDQRPIVNIEIPMKLRKIILSDLYSYFFEQGFQSIVCKFHNLKITCKTWDDKKLSSLQKNNLNSNFLYSLNYSNQNKPRCAEISLFDLSSSKNHSINQVEDFFNLKIKDLATNIRPKNFTLSAISNNIKLFHKIQINFLLKKEYEINIGETKRSTVNTGVFTQSINESYFSGIKLNFKIKRSQNGLIINTKNQFSRSDNIARQTTKNITNSSTLIRSDSPTVFINYQNIISTKSSNGIFFILRNFLLGIEPNAQKTNKLIKGVIQIHERCQF
jgi:hypothetical protein